MAYGTLKVDTITFTNGGADQSITVSGIVQSISGDITATGTISGDVIQGGTLVSGATVTGAVAQFTTVTGGTAGFTTITGTTITGTTANFGGTLTATSGVFASGTEAAPSVSVGATDNGLYSPGTDQVAISTNGSGRLFVDSSGRIGINAASPTAGSNLDVQAATPAIRVGATTGTNSSALWFNNTGGNAFVGVEQSSGGYFATGTGAYALTLSHQGAYPISFATNNTERMRLDSSGRLGLGTSSPGDRLEVDGNGLFYGNTGSQNGIFVGSNSSFNWSIQRENVSTGRLDFSVTAGGSPSTKLTILSDGNVGIGTQTPSSALDVNGIIATNSAFYAYNATNDGLGIWYNPGAAGVNQLTARLGGSDRLTIDSSGRVGIGTSSPGALLDVRGGINVSSSALVDTVIQRSQAPAGAYRLILSGGAGLTGETYPTAFPTDAAAGAMIALAGGAPATDAFGGGIGYYANGSTSPDGAGSGNQHVFYTRSAVDTYTERLRIDAAGKVGIGSTAPATQFAVQNASTSLGVEVDTTSGFASGPTLRGYYRAGSAYTTLGLTGSQVAFGINDVEKARLDASGRFLVGTSSGTGNNLLQVKGSTLGAGYPGGAFFNIGLNVASVDSNFELGRIDFGNQEGYLGASIVAAADLDWNASDYPSRLVFSTTADGASSPTTRMTIKNDGNVIIPAVYSSTTATAANVNVNTDGYLIRSVSSIKYKTNVETLQDSYADSILNCRPVWYQSTSDYDNSEWGYWGLIAEEVAEIDPRLCSFAKNEDGGLEPEGVQYDRFVPHLLNLIKRQKEQIEAMEARLSALEGV